MRRQSRRDLHRLHHLVAEVAGGPRNEVGVGGGPDSRGGEARGPSPQRRPPFAARDRWLLVSSSGGTAGAAAWTGTALDGRHLPGFAGPPVHHLVLAPGFGYRRDRPGLGPDQLPVPGPGGRLSDDRHSNRRYR